MEEQFIIHHFVNLEPAQASPIRQNRGAQRSNHPCWLHWLQRELRWLLIVPPLKSTLHIRHDLHLALHPLHTPLLLLLKQHLLDLSHLDPDPHTHRNRNQEDCTEHDGLDQIVVAVLNKKYTQVHEKDLLRQ